MEEINILYTLEYLREHKNKVYWYNVSMFANLLEEFILEFYDNIKWVNILHPFIFLCFYYFLFNQ